MRLKQEYKDGEGFPSESERKDLQNTTGSAGTNKNYLFLREKRKKKKEKRKKIFP